MVMAGLLAYSLLNTFPLMQLRTNINSGLPSAAVNNSVESFTQRAYSYGDSAGLAPDFPF